MSGMMTLLSYWILCFPSDDDAKSFKGFGGGGKTKGEGERGDTTDVMTSQAHTHCHTPVEQC